MLKAISYWSSLPASYRLTHAMWVGCSAAYAIVYLFVADLVFDRPQGLSLAFTILLPAIFVPVYIWRANFVTRTEAVIRCAAPGLAFSGLPATLHHLATRSYPIGGATEHDRLQVGYVSLVLLLLGLGSGIELGVLRWEFLEQATAPATVARPVPVSHRYVKSAILWIAGVMACAWVLTGVSSIHAADALALSGLAAFGPGLLLIAPISVLFSPRPPLSLGKRVWKYWSKCLLVGCALVALYMSVATLGAGLFGTLYMVEAGVYFLPAFGLICLPWAVLSGLAEQPSPQNTNFTPTPLGPALQRLRPLPTWKAVLLALAAQPCILLPALWTSSPSPLGLRGIGCVNAHDTYPWEYWFWHAYKGIGSSSESSNGLIYRLAADSHVCGVVGTKAPLDDPKQVTMGYANAARAWFWLIDPDEWESPRTREIRQELALLLGKEFSSYDELQSWWNQNNKHLVWSGKDELLEVHEPTISDMAHRNYTLTSMSAVEIIRQEPRNTEYEPATETLDNRPMHSLAFFDREERLRGLKLAVADQIAILSGQRDRDAREFLQRLTGQYFATKVEWDNYLVGNPPAPWNMSRESAQSWVGQIQLYGRAEPYRTHQVTELREATGLNYSMPEDFIPWLQNPDNTRQEEWFKARALLGDLMGKNPSFTLDQATSTLKLITDQSFGYPEAWMGWWQENHSRVRLSPDGRKLTAGR